MTGRRRRISNTLATSLLTRSSILLARCEKSLSQRPLPVMSRRSWELPRVLAAPSMVSQRTISSMGLIRARSRFQTNKRHHLCNKCIGFVVVVCILIVAFPEQVSFVLNWCRAIPRTKTGGSQCVGLLMTISISFIPRVSAKEFAVKTSAPEAKESTSIANRDLLIPGS